MYGNRNENRAVRVGIAGNEVQESAERVKKYWDSLSKAQRDSVYHNLNMCEAHFGETPILVDEVDIWEMISPELRGSKPEVPNIFNEEYFQPFTISEEEEEDEEFLKKYEEAKKKGYIL